MPFLVTCPQCKRKLKLGENALGKRIKCSDCGTIFAASGKAPATSVSRSRADAAPAGKPPARGSAGRAAGPADAEESERPTDSPRRRRKKQSNTTRNVIVGAVLGVFLIVGPIVGGIFWLAHKAKNAVNEMVYTPPHSFSQNGSPNGPPPPFTPPGKDQPQPPPMPQTFPGQPAAGKPIEMTAEQLAKEDVELGEPALNAKYQGKTLRVRGKVQSVLENYVYLGTDVKHKEGPLVRIAMIMRDQAEADKLKRKAGTMVVLEGPYGGAGVIGPSCKDCRLVDPSAAIPGPKVAPPNPAPDPPQPPPGEK